MAAPKTRNRLVTFRLSVEEYESLRGLCENHSVRSVSEFARTAVLGRMDTMSRRTFSASEDLTSLHACLEDLDGALRQLSGHISTVLAIVQPPLDQPQTLEANRMESK